MLADSEANVRYDLEKHIFLDNPTRLEFFGSEKQSTFINYQDIISKQDKAPDGLASLKILKVEFYLGNKQVIHKR